MSNPIRVQRKRTKGWKNPPNTVYVGRPTEFGNEWNVKEGRTAEDCVRLYENMLSRLKESEQQKIIDKLKGKNLSCWCKIGNACHADSLLKFCNKKSNYPPVKEVLSKWIYIEPDANDLRL